MKSLFLIVLAALSIDAATYRVIGNGGRGYQTTQDGSSGNEYKGCYGLQKVLRVVTAGDSILVYAPNDTSIYLDRLVTLTTGTDKSATWAVGDSIQNLTGTGNDWTAVLCSLSTTTIIAELRTGTYATVATADGIENVTKVDNTTLSEKACNGVGIVSKSGTSTAYIRLFGCNTTFDTLKLSYINGRRQATSCIFGTSSNYIHLSYLHLDSAVNNNLNSTNAQDHWKIEKIKSTNAGWSGFHLYLCKYSDVFYCYSYNNVREGFYCSGYYDVFKYCKSYSNGYNGFNLEGNRIWIDICLSYSNTRSGVRISTIEAILTRSILHANSYSGVTIESSSVGGNVYENRLTANTLYGINCVSLNNSIYEDYNYLQGNTSGNRNNISGIHSVDGSDTDYGYVDYTNGNFSLSDNATHTKDSVTIGW